MTILTIPRAEAAKWDLRFLDMAKLVASWSKDPSTQTGAVIVRPDRSVASVGFNGFPHKMSDDPALYANRDEKYSRVVHCEMNALLYADEKVNDFWLYTHPFISCDRCFVHMAQAGITRFVAPCATPAQLERWGAAFDRVRGYAKDMGLDLIEIEG
jgi:dCMP deaminase